jgi:hypothetical protein
MLELLPATDRGNTTSQPRDTRETAVRVVDHYIAQPHQIAKHFLHVQPERNLSATSGLFRTLNT